MKKQLDIKSMTTFNVKDNSIAIDALKDIPENIRSIINA